MGKNIRIIIYIILIFFSIYIIYIVMDTKRKNDIIEKNTTQFINDIDDIRNLDIDKIEISSITKFDWDEAYTFIPYTPQDYQEMAMGKQRGVKFFTPNEGDTCLAFLNKGEVVCYLCMPEYKFDFSIVFVDKDIKTYYSKFKKTDNFNFVINRRYDEYKGIYILDIYIEK